MGQYSHKTVKCQIITNNNGLFFFSLFFNMKSQGDEAVGESLDEVISPVLRVVE